MFVNSVSVEVVTAAYGIADDYLKRTGQIARNSDIDQGLLDAVINEYRAGVHNAIKLANRAIARFERLRALPG